MSRTAPVSLPQELEAEVAAAVARGEFASERDAVAEWHTQRMVEVIGIEKLRRLWNEGVESGAGRSLSIDDIKAEARRRFARR